jgi:ORF6N domain
MTKEQKFSDALAVQVERRILLVRGQNVILDFDLAQLYGVETRVLKQAVRRNLDRFPADFMFELTAGETETLVSQTVIPTRGKLGGAVPMAFTEEGVAMLSSVLRSRRAVQVNIAIMRTFVRLREMLLSNAELARKLAALENKYDAQFKVVFDAIRELMLPPAPPKRQIGFHVREGATRGYRVRRRK